MSATVASGTQTAVIGTAHTLASITALGVYQLIIDTAATDIADILEVTISTRVLAGGALSVFKRQMIRGGGVEDVFQSVPLFSDVEFTITLKQTAGTGRAFPWKVVGL